MREGERERGREGERERASKRERGPTIVIWKQRQEQGERKCIHESDHTF